MSHFVLLVAMKPTDDVAGKLEEMLHPFDETREDIPEYRDYEDAKTPESFWLYTSMQRTAEEVAVGDRSSVKPYKPNEIGWSSAYDRDNTEDEQWAKLELEAEAFHQFSNPPTWREVIEYANNRWYPEGENEDNRQSILRYDEEKDRAYTYSTYNPNSKWDWYQVGGRWSGYFPVKQPLDMEDAADLIQGQRSWTNEGQPREAWTVDGGPIRLLDLELLRARKGTEAGERYDAYQALVQDLPEALPFRVFSEDAQATVALLTNRQEITDTWDRAREAYNSQPRVRAARDSEQFKWDFECLIGEFAVSREFYVEKARNAAVPGFALLTPEGEWVAPGEMGWFGMSTNSEEDTAMFKTKANAYIEALDPDTLLIAVDCHI